MKMHLKKQILCAVLAAGAAAFAADAPPKAGITRLDLFRDASVAVYRQLDAGEAGQVLRLPMDDEDILFSSLRYDPELIAKVAKAVWEDGEKPEFSYVLMGFAGRTVRVTLADQTGHNNTYEGVLTYPPNDAKYFGDSEIMFCLETDKGGVFFQKKDVRGIKLKERQGLAFTFHAQGTPAISYVSRGIGWAPYCEIELREGGKIGFRQFAEILNAWGDFADVPVSLVSGDKGAIFANRLSLLDPRQAWDGFLGSAGYVFRGNNAPLAASSFRAKEAASYAEAEEVARGTDFFFNSLEKLSMKKGDALNLPLLTAEISARRLVKWQTQSLDYGNYRMKGTTADMPAYDSVIFKNPFKQPIADSPVAIYQDGRALAQAQMEWVNPDSETTVRMWAAKGFDGTFEDVGEAGGGGLLSSGKKIIPEKVKMTGSLKFKNTRITPMDVEIVRTVRGAFVSADGEPAMNIVPVWDDPNDRVTMTWKLTLAPGEEKTLAYVYNKLRKD